MLPLVLALVAHGVVADPAPFALDPATPSTDDHLLYSCDNGAGKIALCIPLEPLGTSLYINPQGAADGTRPLACVGDLCPA